MKIKKIFQIIDEKKNDIWSKIVDKDIQDESKLEIKDNVAIIYTKDQIYANEFNILKDDFLKKIKTYDKNVEKLFVKVDLKKFKNKTLVINKKERDFKEIMEKNRKIALKVFENIKDDENKRYLVASLAIKLVKDEYIKNAGGKKCENCHEYFKGSEKKCPICTNEINFIQKKKIKKMLLDNPYLTEEYVTKIYEYDRTIYLQAKDEVLTHLFLKIKEKFISNEDYNLLLDKYVKIEIQSKIEEVLNIRKKAILDRLNHLLGGEKNVKNK